MIRKTRKRSAPSTAPKSSGQKIKGLTLKTPDLKQDHEDSKEAEERYRRIFDNSKDMFYATSSDGRHVDVNQTGVDLLGYGSREEMMHVYARDVFLDPADQKRFMNEVVKTGFVKDFETKLKRKDGTPIDVLITANARSDDSRKIVSYEGSIKDISDRKRMEEELVQRTRELEALNEMGSLINQMLDIDKVLPIALEKAVNLTGYEMGGIHLANEEERTFEFKHHFNHSTRMAEMAKVLKYGEGVAGRAVILKRPIIVSVDDHPFPQLAAILRKEGVQTVLAFPLFGKGKVVGAISLLSRSRRDLSQSEVHLLESIGNQIGLALVNAKLFSQVAKAKSEWETTFDAVTDLITIYGRDYRILRANKAVFERLGLDPKQVIGKKCHEIYYSRKTPCEGCNVSEVLKTEKPASGERESKRLKGVFQSYAFPIFDQAGQVVCVVNFNREVTEEKRLALEKEVVNNVNKILASNPDVKQMIQAVHAELKTILDSERMAIALFDEELKGFHYLAQAKDYEPTELKAASVYPREGTHFERVVETGLPVIISDAVKSDLWLTQELFKEEGIRSTLIYPLEYKEKIIGTMNFSSKKAKHFSEGQFSLLRQIAPGLAISIQNAFLFEEMRQSEEKYRTVIETMQEGYFELDLAGTYTFANDMECRNFGYTRNELVGMNYRQYVDRKTAEELSQTFNRLYNAGEPIKLLEIGRVRKDGTKAFSEISASLIRDSEGKPIGFRGISRDVTERKRTEEVLKKSEAEARRLSQENAIMAEIGQIISSTLKIDDVYERFAEKVREIIPLDRISINTINSRNQTFTIAYFAGTYVEGRSKGTVVPLVGTLGGEVARTRTKILARTEDLENLADRFPAFSKTVQAGIRSLMVIPLISKDEAVGVLHIQSTRPDVYGEEDLRLAEKVGHQIAGAIANAELFKEWQQADEALRESEKRFKELFDMAPTGYYELDTSGCITRVNQTELEMLGYAAHEMIGRPIWDFLEEREIVRQNLNARLAGALPPGKGIERTSIRKDGSRVPVLIEERLLEDKEGRIMGVRATMQNHMEFKQAQEALRRSEEAARRLAQENAIMAEIGRIVSSSLNLDEVYERFTKEVARLISFDRIVINIVNSENETTAIAYASGADIPGRQLGVFIPLAGTATGECMRTRSSMLIQPEDMDECLARFPALLPTFQAGLQSIIFVPLISKDQFIGVLSLRSFKPKAYTDQDVRLTERVANQIAGAIASVQLFIARQQAEEALKRNQEELIKKNKEIEEHRGNLQLALEELERAYNEVKATQSKILQQEKMASIGQLAAGVAHEINNPVAFISSNLGTLNKYVGRLTEFIQTQSQEIESLQMTDAVERLKKKQKELKLDYITEDIKGLIAESLDGSERVMKIVQGLKRFSRVDEADYKYADLNECIDSTVNIVWNELKYKATLKKDYGKLPLTKCYPQQINQVFMNLLINAAHAIEKQGEITIKTWEQDKSIWAAISDTGFGIPKEHLNKIFEPFFTTKEVGKGTGLGLSITYEIVQKHNGEITVESEVGKGTTFTVRIPIV